MASMNKEYKEARLSNYAGTQLNEKTYNMTIGLTLLWGVAINIVMATVLSRAIFQLNYWLVLIIYLAGSIGCSVVTYRAKTPAAGFAGFTGLAASMGLLLTYYVAFFTAHSVAYAFISTGLVTIIMVLLATLYPGFFRSLGRTLGISLLICLGVEIIGALFLGAYLTVVDYVIALIFCGFIGFDWARSQQYPMTTNNAIACAADIYVDVINLFIRILEITGRRSR